jgi:hypothetical protein
LNSGIEYSTQVTAGVEVTAKLELMLLEQSPAVVRAELKQLVAVAVDPGDARLEVELSVRPPGHTVAMVAVVEREVGLQRHVPAVLFGCRCEPLPAAVLGVAKQHVGAAQAEISDQPPQPVPADQGAAAQVGRGRLARDRERCRIAVRVLVLVDRPAERIDVSAPRQLRAMNGGIEERAEEQRRARADLAVQQELLVEAAEVVLGVADAERQVAGQRERCRCDDP